MLLSYASEPLSYDSEPLSYASEPLSYDSEPLSYAPELCFCSMACFYMTLYFLTYSTCSSGGAVKKGDSRLFYDFMNVSPY